MWTEVDEVPDADDGGLHELDELPLVDKARVFAQIVRFRIQELAAVLHLIGTFGVSGEMVRRLLWCYGEESLATFFGAARPWLRDVLELEAHALRALSARDFLGDDWVARRRVKATTEAGREVVIAELGDFIKMLNDACERLDEATWPLAKSAAISSADVDDFLDRADDPCVLMDA